jgi:hypothetical protein
MYLSGFFMPGNEIVSISDFRNYILMFREKLYI